jgi:hypothetical protein
MTSGTIVGTVPFEINLPADAPPPTADAPLPTIVSAQQVGIHARSTTFVLTFSTDMTAASVENVSNYELRGPKGRLDPIALATYNTKTNSVTLRTKFRLNSHRYYRLEVYSQGSKGVKSKAGVALDGMKTGLPGHNYFATVHHFSLTPSLP